MVRSLSQWTKTLSFPARISPNRNSKDCNVNVHPISQPPALPRKNQQSSPSPPPSNNVPITEISQIVSENGCIYLYLLSLYHWTIFFRYFPYWIYKFNKTVLSFPIFNDVNLVLHFPFEISVSCVLNAKRLSFHRERERKKRNRNIRLNN